MKCDGLCGTTIQRKAQIALIENDKYISQAVDLESHGRTLLFFMNYYDPTILKSLLDKYFRVLIFQVNSTLNTRLREHNKSFDTKEIKQESLLLYQFEVGARLNEPAIRIDQLMDRYKEIQALHQASGIAPFPIHFLDACHGKSQVYVAHDHCNQINGVVICQHLNINFPNMPRSSILAGLSVREDKRNMKIAVSLLLHAVRQASINGIMKVFAVIEESNIAAIRCFESVGFTHDKEMNVCYLEKCQFRKSRSPKIDTRSVI